LSSVNISNSFGSYINKNAELQCLKGKTCQILKKLFDSDGMPEELDDYESCKTKTDKSGKGLQLLEYLVPIHTSLPNTYSQRLTYNEVYGHDLATPLNSYSKIHLPPPEAIL